MVLVGYVVDDFLRDSDVDSDEDIDGGVESDEALERERADRHRCRCHRQRDNGHKALCPLSCVKLAGDDRDIDLYHWSSERFSSAWINTISVLLAKGRARVSVADAATDWPKRIRDMQYLDHESIVAGA